MTGRKHPKAGSLRLISDRTLWILRLLNDNKHITIVGEVVGSTTIKIDEIEKQVPEMKVKHITVWDRDNLRAYYPHHGYYAPYGYGYRGYYGYPYYW